MNFTEWVDEQFPHAGTPESVVEDTYQAHRRIGARIGAKWLLDEARKWCDNELSRPRFKGERVGSVVKSDELLAHLTKLVEGK